jgi:hypothetical protein
MVIHVGLTVRRSLPVLPGTRANFSVCWHVSKVHHIRKSPFHWINLSAETDAIVHPNRALRSAHGSTRSGPTASKRLLRQPVTPYSALAIGENYKATFKIVTPRRYIDNQWRRKRMKRRDFLKVTGVGLAACTVAAPAIAQSMPEVKWRLTAS